LVKYKRTAKFATREKKNIRLYEMRCYALRFEEKECLFTLPEKALATPWELACERELCIADKKKYRAQLSDEKDVIAPEMHYGLII
jgi:hypothetical protein